MSYAMDDRTDAVNVIIDYLEAHPSRVGERFTPAQALRWATHLYTRSGPGLSLATPELTAAVKEVCGPHVCVQRKPNTCPFVLIVGHGARAEEVCDEPTEGELCAKHQGWVNRLASHLDQPLEIA